MQPESNYTFRGGWEVNFDLLWPPLDKEFLARLDARWERLEAERQARERDSRL